MGHRDFTLILTKGTHAISASAAETILAAIRNSERTVEVEVDLFGGVDLGRKTTLVTAHVIALARNPQVQESQRSAACTSDSVVARARRSRAGLRPSVLTDFTRAARDDGREAPDELP
jgi:hypothetical protein